MRGAVEQLRQRPLLDDPPGIHHRRRITEPRCDRQIVRNEDDAHAALALKAPQQREDLRLQSHVQCAGRLVADQQLGPAGDGNRDRHALAHAAAELERILVDPAAGIGDADRLQRLGGQLPQSAPVPDAEVPRAPHGHVPSR
jgi:hypothetical protein